MIESTCAVVIDVQAANCCGASALKSGTPRPPCVVVKGEALIDRTKLEEVGRQSPLGLDRHNPQTIDSIGAHKVGEI